MMCKPSRMPPQVFKSFCTAFALVLTVITFTLSGQASAQIIPRPKGPPSAACFKPEITVVCGPDGTVVVTVKTASGVYNPDQLEVSSLTPGVTVNPANVNFISSGGVTKFTLIGAKPGSKVSLQVNGTQYGKGSFASADLCCSQLIEVPIPDAVCSKPPKFAIDKTCEACRPGVDCKCKITVTSSDKTSVYPGNLTVTETLTQTSGSPVLITGTSSAQPWVCAPATPTPGPLKCDINGAALAANLNTSVIDVTIKIPADAKGVKNCANLPANKNDGPWSEIPTRSCSNIVVKPDMPQLEVTKKQSGGDCSPGGLCQFTIVIKNPSTTLPANGSIPITEDMGVAGNVLSMTPPLCTPTPATVPFTCNANVNLAPGQSQTVVLALSIPMSAGVPTSGASFKNCFGVDTAVTNTPGKGGGTTTVSEGCATFTSCGFSCHMQKEVLGSLTIEKTAKTAACQKGEPCTFSIKISNTSGVAVPTPLSFIDKLPVGAANYVGITPSPWSCGPVNGAASNFPHTMECKHPPGTTIAPGQSMTADVTFTIKPGFTGSTLQNCSVLNVKGWEGQLPSSSRIASAANTPKFEVDQLRHYLLMRNIEPNSAEAAKFSQAPSAAPAAAPPSPAWTPDDKSCASVNVPQTTSRINPTTVAVVAAVAAVAAGAILIPKIVKADKPTDNRTDSNSCPPGTQRTTGACSRVVVDRPGRCDLASAVPQGNTCACRYEGAALVSATVCACPRGMRPDRKSRACIADKSPNECATGQRWNGRASSQSMMVRRNAAMVRAERRSGRRRH